MRCMTLADELVARGAHVAFICKALDGAMIEPIRQRGFACHEIAAAPAEPGADAADTLALIAGHRAPVDWLIVDHYGLDHRWEQIIRPVVRHLMVVDDLANRSHDCDLLLDQNYYADMASRYDGLVPARTALLLGPEYVLLRPDFRAARRALRPRNGPVRRMIVFFGGTDPLNLTAPVLRGIEQLGRSDIAVDVVVGGGNPHRGEIEHFCLQHAWAHYHCQVSNMAELIAAADLGVGAGGAAMWERCALGLPTLTVVFADNQVRTTTDVAQTGAIAYLGWAQTLSDRDYARAIGEFIDRPAERAAMADAALNLIDASANGAIAVARAMDGVMHQSRSEHG